ARARRAACRPAPRRARARGAGTGLRAALPPTRAARPKGTARTEAPAALCGRAAPPARSAAGWARAEWANSARVRAASPGGPCRLFGPRRGVLPVLRNARSCVGAPRSHAHYVPKGLSISAHFVSRQIVDDVDTVLGSLL